MSFGGSKNETEIEREGEGYEDVRGPSARVDPPATALSMSGLQFLPHL